MRRLQPTDLGMALVVSAGFGFGLNALFARLAYADGLTPASALLYRFAGLLVVTLLFGAPALRRPALAAKGLLLGALMGVGTLGYFHALEVLPVATAAMIYYTYPLFTVLLGWWVTGRRPHPGALAATVLVLAACALIVDPGAGRGARLEAMLSCFLAPVAFALLIHGLVGWLTVLPPLVRIATTTLGHLMVLVPAALLWHGGRMLPDDAVGWGAVLGLATIASLIPQICFLYGAPLAGAERTAVGGGTELPTAVLIGWWVFSEPIRPQGAVAAALLVAAIFLVHREPGRGRAEAPGRLALGTLHRDRAGRRAALRRCARARGD